MIKETVSILLATRNRAEHLKPTLDSIEETHVPAGWFVELLLIDNGSEDETISVMRTFSHPDMEARIIREARPGKSRALNRAIEESKGNVLLFTDDDVRVPTNWIEGMSSQILSGCADAVSGGVEIASEIMEEWMTPEHRSWLASTELISSENPEHMVGANMAVGKHVLEVVQNFDTDLGGGALGNAEDTLFGWQIKEAGFKIAGALDVVVEHHPDTSRFTRKSFCKMARDRGRSEAYVNFHWRNNTDYKMYLLIGGIIQRGLRLLSWRVNHINEIINRSVPSTQEFELIRRFYRAGQHLLQFGSEPKYNKYGLKKKHELTKE